MTQPLFDDDYPDDDDYDHSLPEEMLHKVGDQLFTDPANRSDFDFYPTPEKLARAALFEGVRGHLEWGKSSPRSKTILDPGAGTGVWGKYAREFFPNAIITGYEIRDTPKPEWYDYWLAEDFLSANITQKFDLVIGNPPYGRNYLNQKDTKIAEKFVRKGLSLLTPKTGQLIYLLLTSFLESTSRQPLFRDFPLATVLTCVNRPSFKSGFDKKTGKERIGGTDARSYSIFYWRSYKFETTKNEDRFNTYHGGWLNWK